MPHSSGGGSHGGGSHGGGSHGGSGPHISSHYFSGARRYRRYHTSTGQEEYVYADRMPQKAGIGGIIFIGVMALIFTGAVSAGIKNDIPKKLGAHYLDSPAVYDNIDVIKDEDALLNTLNEYQELTGICPVIHTEYVDKWLDSYEDLESYTFDAYVDNFSDEEHFVIVYTIPREDAQLMKEGVIHIPNYAWEAVQGDYTDPILTETVFSKFANTVQDALERGYDPGVAFDAGFKYLYRDGTSKLSPSSPTWIFTLIKSIFPLVFIVGFFGVFLFLAIKSYIKNKDVVYSEVPLDNADLASASGSFPGITDPNGFNDSRRQAVQNKVTKAGSIIGMICITPFLLSGFGMIGSAILMMNSVETGAGVFMLIFGIAWTLISGSVFFSMLKPLIKGKKKEEPMPLTAEYPKAEYPDIKPVTPNTYTASVPFATPPSATPETPEFDPQFFGSAASDYESDDEDYKRMKRQGYE